jgi:hypothetical protein
MHAPETTTTDPAAPARSGWWSALGLSLLVTAVAALFSLVLRAAFGTDWSIVFVVTRWMVVFALLLLPIAHQLVVRTGRTWDLPWSLRTPATGLLLTIEGIAWDIVAANVH